jgi:hypothetical protein
VENRNSRQKKPYGYSGACFDGQVFVRLNAGSAVFVGGFDSMQASSAKESRTSMLDGEGIMTFDTDLKSE